MNIFREFWILIIKLYKKIISPILPPTCRFTPSCSEYAILAIRKYGFFSGFVRSGWRILRCNPLNKHTGWDPP